MNFEVNDKIVPIIVAIGDHVRLSERDFKELFGDEYGELTKALTLGQEGEWLTEERIVITSNGRATEVPIIMPFVKKTEICLCSSTLYISNFSSCASTNYKWGILWTIHFFGISPIASYSHST